jgi:hypothetical protein
VTSAPLDKQKLLPLLEELNKAIEDLLLTGLTTASDATRQTLNVSFQEASRFGLLRLGGTLKVACDELGRFTRNQPDFSRKRFSFFLNRAWLLSKGLSKALREQNESEFERLKWVPANKPVKHLELVTIGVNKKVVPNAFCAFEFRLRSVDTESDEILPNQKLIWSCVYPIKPGSEIPPEGYLHMPQKQAFNAVQFLDGKTILIENGSMAVDAFGSARLTFNEQTTVSFGGAYKEWDPHLCWEADEAVDRLRAHQPTPLELDNELQEEIVLKDWSILEAVDDPDQDQIVFPLVHNSLVFKAVVSRGVDGLTLLENLKELQKLSERPALFALLHYEKCRLVLQPLTTFDAKGPKHLMLGKEQINRATLLKALKF